MRLSRQIMIRDTGTALAVLALYVLTLLLPLHQAAGLQRDLNALGYSTLSAWSVCQPLTVDRDRDKDSPAALACPAMGAGQHHLAMLLPPAPALAPLAATAGIGLEQPAPAHSARLPDHVGQSRAPPVPA
ncbi:MAG: hypothetical protein ABS76_30015 [Pelagibacterium sp. SCN 64-44]|nr:MAG: hypothetical protein ABS76_30015 [Pelagibacterium sp. SCN 64-44]